MPHMQQPSTEPGAQQGVNECHPPPFSLDGLPAEGIPCLLHVFLEAAWTLKA